MAAVVRAALKICAGAEQERAQLAALVRHAGDGVCSKLGLPLSGSQIQPVIVGADTPRRGAGGGAAGTRP